MKNQMKSTRVRSLYHKVPQPCDLSMISTTSMFLHIKRISLGSQEINQRGAAITNRSQEQLFPFTLLFPHQLASTINTNFLQRELLKAYSNNEALPNPEGWATKKLSNL
jgi:hypothetical protein